MAKHSGHADTAADNAALELVSVNQEIEEAVVAKNFLRLEALYSDDFVFTHGTGLVQTKSEWLNSFRGDETRYLSRQADRPSVELHNNIALLTGQLIIHRRSRDGDARYGVRYIRVYSKTTAGWQLVSHRTIAQWDR